MVWTVKNVTVIVVLILVAAWFFRHEYVTRTVKDVTCVERVNRFTRDRCLASHDVPACTRIVASEPCDE